ncbi:MAG: hypothetical protein JWM85_2514 [Acidimicrobiaceae bacterium]|nr:hypothetical protein [Acidimicrobiaceae bacterium]
MDVVGDVTTESAASEAMQRGATAVQTVTDTVRSQAASVSDEAANQARQVVDQVQSQLQQQLETEMERLAGALEQFGQQARAMAEGRPEEAGALVDYARASADRIEGLASEMRDRGLWGLLGDAEAFARRRPGAFLVGGALAGAILGRMVRARGGGADGGGHSEPKMPVATMPVPVGSPVPLDDELGYQPTRVIDGVAEGWR